MAWRGVALLCLAACGSNPAPKKPPPPALELVYLANEGVLLRHGELEIVIDGFHRFYHRDYAVLPDDKRRDLENARPPFDKIDLILVSHHHGDHFDPEAIAEHMRANKKVRLVSSAQVTDKVREVAAAEPAILGRIETVEWEAGTRRRVRAAGIDIEFLGLSHGAGKFASIENFGHLFTMGGKRIVHVGDAEPADYILTEKMFAGPRIDIALVPFWYITSSRVRPLFQERINPRQTIAFHIDPAKAKIRARAVQAFDPEALAMIEMLKVYVP